ncbi:hypothetical protein GCM10023205_34140 [Yinghuangia aomiensis]|uniref:Ketosynthase family 3 (KS3) domain-containing protein n=1 Tax=Yinghuangia aomiensis TaxID=676205 RepID=A0ABP9HBR2_9ACTN
MTADRARRTGGPRPTDAAIVGIGAVFPGAPDAPAFWANVAKGVDAITDVPPHRWDPDVYFAPGAATGPVHADRFYCRKGGFVDEYAAFEPTRFGIMPSAVDGAEPDQLLALRTAAEALADAGGEDRLADRSRVGVVFGRGGYMGVATARLDQRVRTAHQLVAVLRDVAPEFDEERLTAVRTAFQAALGPEQPDASIGLVPSFTASRIANRLDLGGPAYTVDAACATSLLAVDHAVAELASGRCDAVIAGAVHHCHIATLWSVFTQLRALSPAMRIRPFDRSADGTLISEGTGAVVLKRLADAERDGDRIYAVVRGVGISSDGRAASLMSPLADGQVRALDRAWTAAGLDPRAPDALGLLEAHGTGTPVGDGIELETLARVFGPPTGRPDVVVGSVKSNIGHAMQAAGMAGLLKAVYAVHHAVLPPTLHVDAPHPALARTRMRVTDAAEPWDAPVRRAGIDAFGFGGVNAHVVVEQPPAGRAAALPTGAGRLGDASETAASMVSEAAGAPLAAVPVLRLAADSTAALALRLTEYADSAARSDRPEGPPDPGRGACRLALLNPTPKRIDLARRVLARGEPWRGRSDLWFTPRPLLGPHAARPGTVAFLFPGLEPGLQPELDDVADAFGLPLPSGLGTDDIVGRALDALGAGRLLTAALGRLGIRPAVLAGHSVGEWTAMVVAGMYPDSALDVFLGSLGPGSVAVPDLVYAAVACGAPRASAACAAVGGVVVSHENCPHQCVVCGPEDAVARVLERLRGEGVLGQEMPFRSGFHTPMWEPYVAQVRAAFDKLPLRTGRVPVWSATTVAPFPEKPGAVRELTIRHLLEPVRFGALAERLHDTGVRAFVQVGAGSLGGFVDDALPGADILTVSAHGTRRPGLAGIAAVAAALWTEGYEAAPTSAATTAAGKSRADAGTATGPGPASSIAAAVAAQPGSAASRRRPVPAVRLNLGSPLIRLDPTALATAAGPSAAVRPGTVPTLAAPGPAGPHPAAPRRGTGHPGTGSTRTPPVPLVDAASAPTGPRTRTGPSSAVPSGAADLGNPVLAAFAAILNEAGDAATRARQAWANRAPAPPHPHPHPHPQTVPPTEALRPPTVVATQSGQGVSRPTAPAMHPRASGPAAAAPHGPNTPAPQAPSRPTGPTTPTPGPAAPAHRSAANHPMPRLTRRQEFSLRTLPYVADHCIYEQHDRWPDASDRFPVVPMTTLLHLAGEAARALVPGRVVTGYQDVRALRWLPVAPPTDAEVTAARLDADRVQVSISGYTTTVVVLGTRPRPPEPGDDTPLTGEGPAPVRAADLYAGRWMFHGPGFAGVDEITAIADDGIRGVLRCLPAPGALLDAAGQLLGHWMQVKLPTDRLVFPVSVDHVHLYGPPPAPGDRLAATARIRDVTATTVRGDVELRGSVDGLLRARLTGWTYRRFAADERVWPMKFTPHTTGVGEPQPEGWYLVRTRWPDAASQELVMRRYLDAAERAEFASVPPRARAGWLLGRIAAKDAARGYLWARGEGPMYPAEIHVRNLDGGQPAVSRIPVADDPDLPPSDSPALPHISLAHKDRIAVALAGRGPVGIDVETLADLPDAVARTALTDDERTLLADLADGDPAARTAWLVRFWCAKEAAGKADGTGLAGRPRAWRVVRAGGDTLVLAGPSGGHTVRTRVVADGPDRYVVAWTVPAAAPAPTTPQESP